MRPFRVLAFILVVLLFPPGIVWAQQTIYGCVKNNNGQIRIVAAGEACLPSEHAVQWTLGQSGSNVPPPPATPGPLRVLDQNGVAVGMFVPSSGAARLVGDQWVSLPVGTGGFQVSDPAYFMTFYQTADCSGDAYLPVDTGSLLRTGTVMPGGAPGQLIFSYAGKPEVDRTTIQAYARVVGGVWTCYGFTPGPSSPPFGKVASIDVSTFVPPFKIAQ